MSTKQIKLLLLILGATTLVYIGGKVYPSFINQYQDECVSQHLADICYKFKMPSWVEFSAYLTR